MSGQNAVLEGSRLDLGRFWTVGGAPEAISEGPGLIWSFFCGSGVGPTCRDACGLVWTSRGWGQMAFQAVEILPQRVLGPLAQSGGLPQAA